MNITKAMLLAAGLGTRLRPLTNSIPKPMLLVHGKPLIDYALALLARGGIREVMINLHYLPEQIRAHVGDGSRYGLHAHYSLELPEILGTGGGVKKCTAFLAGEPFVLMNADTLIDLDLTALIAHHAQHSGAGTLVIRQLATGETYKPVDIAPDGSLKSFGTGHHFYAGVQIGTNELIAQIPTGQPSCLIANGLQPLLAQGKRIATYLHEGAWNDVGTPERYVLAERSPWS